jgi:hypothetical protein
MVVFVLARNLCAAQKVSLGFRCISSDPDSFLYVEKVQQFCFSFLQLKSVKD